MVSLIKNQILKHLSRYTKNLSPDKINLSTFKGEGELTSVELDENVLTDLLELPSWVRLKSAFCNKVAFRIQWTKLRTIPIYISLDEVIICVETCEQLRSVSMEQGLSSFGATAEYGYISKVIDGITVSVNSVSLLFTSPAFTASLQIMKILVESKSPDWKKVDLKKTRVKDRSGSQVLVFKELEWYSLRLEAKSTHDAKLPPLVLLTNNKSRCRLILKKRVSDSFVMGCRLLIILDELLWVLTDSQLKAVLHFIDSLSDLVKKATEVTRTKKAARKLEVLPEYEAQLSQEARVIPCGLHNSEVFIKFDVIETSYHFWVQKIHLHLSDDHGEGRSCHPNLQNGGALHLELTGLQVDCYPYHLAAADRSHWARYHCTGCPHVQWLSDAHIAFKNSLLNFMNPINNIVLPNEKVKESGDNSCVEEECPPVAQPARNYISEQMAKVMYSCVIIRVADFLVNRVSINNKQSPKDFIKGQRKRRDSSMQDVTIHAELTYYYYPGDIPFPLPAPKFYIHLNPVVINFDVTTILWLNSFSVNLQGTTPKVSQVDPLANYIDVKIEAIMLKVIFEGNNENSYGQRDRPKSLQFQASRIMMSNVRSPDGSSRADLLECIKSLQRGSLIYATDFPSTPDDFASVSEKFINHVQYKDNVQCPVTELPPGDSHQVLHRTMLWTESRDVWCINLDPLWGEFYGAKGVAHNRPVPFLDSFPLKIWFHADLKSHTDNSHLKVANKHAVVYISSLVSLQLNHYQFLFLQKLADDITEVSTVMAMDRERITQGQTNSVVVAVGIPQVELTLVMPSHTPGKESSGADIESVIPDTSSLADETATNPSLQWNPVIASSMKDSVSKTGINTVIHTEVDVSMKCEPVKHNVHSVSSFVLKKSTALLNSYKKASDDFNDSLSTRSDGSSDSENDFGRYSGEDFFRTDGNGSCENIEYASEVVEDEYNLSDHTLSITTTSEIQSNTSFYRRKDTISIATLKFGKVEFVQQSEGFQSSFKVHISNIMIEECPSIPWDEFQNKFSARTRCWNEVCEKPSDRARMKLRFSHSVRLEEVQEWCNGRNGSCFDDCLTVNVAYISLHINSTTLMGIAEFFTDDTNTPPLPVDITLENIDLHVVDDRSMAVYENSTDLNISFLHISRDKTGTLFIEPHQSRKTDQDPKEVDDLREENEQLKRRLAAMERLNEENNHLRKYEEELSVLRSYLNEAQDRVNVLLNDKQCLLDRIKELQCSKGDAKYNSGKR